MELQQKQQIYDMWLACETQTRIEEITGIPRTTIETILSKITKNDENGQVSEIVKFRDFEQEGSGRHASLVRCIIGTERIRSAAKKSHAFRLPCRLMFNVLTIVLTASAKIALFFTVL
jgi:hypothetical protein